MTVPFSGELFYYNADIELCWDVRIPFAGTVISDDSADSGVNTRLENSPPDDNEEGISSTTAQENKKPSFATVLNFNYWFKRIGSLIKKLMM